MELYTPLLSGTLYTVFCNIYQKHPDCEIVEELILIHEKIEKYNQEIKCLNGSTSSDSCETDPIEIKRMVYHKEMLDTLISKHLTDFARAITYRVDDTFSFSFTPKDKKLEYTEDNKWARTNRQEMKPARLLQKLLVKKYSCKDFEDFNNYLKTEIMNNGTFKIVSGSDITKYYNKDYYMSETSTLGKSCMRYDFCEGFFDLYEDYAKMLIYINETYDKIYARAIIWEIDGQIYMDRVYFTNDYIYNLYIDYAKEHRWIIRENNALLDNEDSQYWLVPSDDYKTAKILPNAKIKLKRGYSEYPYLDSFRYLDSETKTLSSDFDIQHVSCCLSDTNGSYTEYGEIYVCDRCNRIERGIDNNMPEDWVYSEYDEQYYCPCCANYCSGLEDYVSMDTEVVYVKTNDFDLRYPLEYIMNNPDFVLIDDKWYASDYYKLVRLYDGSYILKDDE